MASVKELKNARKEKQGSSSKPAGSWAGGFVDILLDTTDKERLKDMAGDGSYSSVEELEELVNAGYKLSFTKDAKGGGRIASLYDNDPESPFYSKALVGRGRTLRYALLSLVYKHVYICEGDWSLAQSKESDDFA
jgi:hypothetical protein